MSEALLTGPLKISSMDLSVSQKALPLYRTTGNTIDLQGAKTYANLFPFRALGRDANYYPEPDKFLPARWLTETGEINEKIKFFNFGFGRRYVQALMLLLVTVIKAGN